jgi:aspartate ammonia-lyase
MVFNIMDAMDLFENAATVFINKCLRDLKVNELVNQNNCKTIIPVLTQLSQQHGYAQVSKLCQQAFSDNKDIRTVLKENNLI